MEKKEKVVLNQCYKSLSKFCSDSQTNNIYMDYLTNLDTFKKKYLLSMFNNRNFNILMILMALYQSLLQNKISWKISEKVILNMLENYFNLYPQKNRVFNKKFYFDILEKNNCIVIAPTLDSQLFVANKYR
ncbi:hypothetical protein ACIZ62_07135 [Acetobacterium carbinolicum]|uniref:hypothetical protein n=1 Tax=Acetobacterium carbinolicum TaxID=52690 RepID=UPI0039BF2E08